MARSNRADQLPLSLRVRIAVTLAMALVGGATEAPGADTPPAKDIGTVSATGADDALTAAPAPGTAAYVAPSRAPLDATQPTSLVGPRFIARSVIPTQNYDSIIKFTPSVQNVEPVGPGLQQNFYQTIRGFSYKQFNSTFDGLVIPGMISSFAPQSGTYFMAHDIGSVEVDRGPGTASTIGYATFGGTVSIRSKPPLDSFTVSPYATAGSFNTSLRGVQVDTGLMPRLGGARGFLDYQALDSDGYLTGTTTRRRNVFGKFEAPVGESTLLTFGGMYNTSITHTPGGATLDQIRRLGANYGLSGDRNSQAFRDYNYDRYSTDFEYLRVRSDLGDGWGIEETPYTASYYHSGTVGLDPNGTAPNLNGRFFINGAAAMLSNAVPGRGVHSDFRDYGNLMRVTKDTSVGQARAGLWFDRNAANAYRTNIVLSQSNLLYAKTAAATPFDYKYHANLTTYQPYLEFAATPLPGLVVTPGLKYTSTTRGLDAPINQGTKAPAKFTRTYDAVQPSIDARYTFTKGVVGYVQVAKGFLAPPLGVLQTLSPQNLSPQDTWNYQIGATWQADRLTVSGDLYYIDFGNRIASRNVNGTTFYFNGGGAIYQGVELEGTAQLGQGLSMYANATLNETHFKFSHVKLAAAPTRTAAIGPIFDRDGVSASLLVKYVGPQYGQDAPINDYRLKSYVTADFAAGYTLPILNGRKLDFRLNVNNIANDHSPIFLNGTAADGKTGLFFTNAGRSVFVSVAASL